MPNNEYNARWRVQEGVAFLDKYAPADWRERVRNAELYMHNFDRCVLALAFKGTSLHSIFGRKCYPKKEMRSNGDIVRQFRIVGVHIDGEALGFMESSNASYQNLQEEWEKELGINERRFIYA